MTFALIGNQNSGKSTLFNQLTGSNQHVGNFPGVTVEKKHGTIRKHKDVMLVDLPGIYSLSPYSAEEVVTRDFLLHNKPDGIINIVDATNLERNLYLTLQLTELGIPIVMALNMMDEITANGIYIDIEKLEKELGIPVMPISASKNDGVDELAERAVTIFTQRKMPEKLDFCEGAVHKVIHAIAHIIEDHAMRANVPMRFAATKIVEGDEPMMRSLALHQNEIEVTDLLVKDMEQEMGTARDAALADMRYDFIEKLCAGAVTKSAANTKEQERSFKIDSVLTHKIFALPIFLGIMLTVFWLTFGPLGGTLSGIFEGGIEYLTDLASGWLEGISVNPWLQSLIIDGIFAGVGSVLSFLPTILVLFFLLSLLEDSGYMARVAFVMDKLLRKIGLSGRSFVPMLLGFGCSVPAIMATRTLASERDRKMTIMLIPFMSCSAKLPIYAMLTQAFFPANQALIMISLYVFGIITGIISALILKKVKFSGKSAPFIMELPAYRLPAAKNVMLHMWEKAKDFLTRAFTVIFLATIVIWLLQRFDFNLQMVESADSMMAMIGRLISPIFAPLGFNNWQSATALITGLTAKEAVVSTFTVLLGTGSLSALFTPLSAFSFLVFTLLYMPCVAALAAVKRELGSFRKAMLMMLYQTCVAWVAAFVVYQVGTLFV